MPAKNRATVFSTDEGDGVIKAVRPEKIPQSASVTKSV